MTLPPSAKDQETYVYSAPVTLLLFLCSKAHGSGNCELSTMRMQCWPLAKPTAIDPGVPKGLEQCVYDDRKHSKSQAQPEGQGGSILTSAFLQSRVPVLICVL